MSTIVIYQERLNEDELSFLHQKEEKERVQFYKIARVFLLLSFICPFIIACLKVVGGAEDPFSVVDYFIGVFFLMLFSSAAVYWSYRNNLYKVKMDIKLGTKTIERTQIMRRQYMELNNKFYFYINSPNKLSIEISEDVFHRCKAGDEINIEYTSFSKFYLGYF